MLVAADDMKNAMGALVAYTGDPNPATLAQFTTKYGRARDEWNTGIKRSTVSLIARIPRSSS